MKGILFILALVVFSSLVYAASDCEHVCCQEYNGAWDDDFDDCRGPQAGFDACVSECEAAVWNAQPQGPGPVGPENTYHYECCASAFILGAVLLGALFAKKTRCREA